MDYNTIYDMPGNEHLVSEIDYYKQYLSVIEAYCQDEKIQVQDEKGLWHDIVPNTFALAFCTPRKAIRIKPKKKYIPWELDNAPKGPFIIFDKHLGYSEKNLLIANPVSDDLWRVKNSLLSAENLFDHYLHITIAGEHLPCGTQLQ